MVTDAGIEGGPVYALSHHLVEALGRDARPVTVVMDLRPDLDEVRLVERLAVRRGGESSSTWLRRAGGLTPVSIGLVREVTGNQLPADATAMAALIKAVPVTVTAPMAIERAISTAGGVAWAELDASFMVRRRPGTFVAGEMVDWDALTGGYLLQATLSTGVAAAGGVLDWLGLR